MKAIRLTFLFMFISTIVSAQAPTIEWEKCFGGTSNDFGLDIIQTSDHGYIIAGITGSKDHDAVGNHSVFGGGFDAFVVKLSVTYTTEWIKCLGGSFDESANCILETSDHGFVVVGSAESIDGDVNDNHGDGGLFTKTFDGWVVKLDSSGEIEWKKCYGGTETDKLYKIISTHDGNYICIGNSNSIDGDIVNPEGVNKGWLLKIDSVGNIISSQVYGGNIQTRFYAITPTRDGGYLIAGEKIPGGFNVANAWFLKINEVGTVEWELDYGTINDIIFDVIQLSDGSFIAVGETLDTLTNIYTVGLVLKISESGLVQWRHQGTADYGRYTSVEVVSDNCFIVGGYSENVANNSSDFLLLKMSNIGNVIWEQYYGETGWEALYSFQQTVDQGFIITGATSYPWTGYHGRLDMWVVKLSPETGIVEHDPTLQFQVYPNPTQNILNLQFNPALLNTPYKIYSITGQLALSGNLTSETMQLNIESFTEGIYILQIGNQTRKIVKF